MAVKTYKEVSGLGNAVMPRLREEFHTLQPDHIRGNYRDSYVVERGVEGTTTDTGEKIRIDVYHHKGVTLSVNSAGYLSLSAYGKEDAITEAISDIERIIKLKFQEVMKD